MTTAAGDTGAATGTPQATGTGATVQVPFGTTTPPATGTVDIKTLIPAEFKDKPYLQGVDSPDKLFKLLDGAQTLLGKPRGLQVPEAGAPKEQVEAYLKAIGRPDNADGYEFEPVEGLKYSDDFTKAVKGLFYQAGVPKDMAKNLQKGFDALQLATQKTRQEQEAASDKEFDTIVDKHFADGRDKAVKQSQALIKSILPADISGEMLDNLSPKQAALLAVVVNKIAEKYVAPDKLPMGDGDGTPQANSLMEMQSEARSIMARPEYWNATHPEYQTLQTKVRDLYQKIGALQQKRK